MSWQHLSRSPAPEGRLEAHFAAQIASAVGNTLGSRKDDFSHTSLRWIATGMLAGEPIAGRRAALDVARLRLSVLQDRAILAEQALAGLTMDAATRWLGSIFEAGLERPEHDLPDHPLARGAAFAAHEDAPLLAAWFGDAAESLEEVTSGLDGASPIRCWPHHFDLASLVALDGERTTTIGVGLSPGDSSDPAPYYYVTPWPYPTASALPVLRVGRWHTSGWTGAVLGADEITRSSDQRALVRRFLDEAIERCRSILRAP
jgi:hypothetical protein